jgi:hypothetical protein
MTDSSVYSPGRHGMALTLVVATLALIFIGGLVTSTHSGLSVPDWPLSFGRLMPPMVGGILFEHGHRLVATGVGILTILTVVVFRGDPRGWVRRASWAALVLVVVQGVLGGLTVLYKLPKPISIAHGTMAQTFFLFDRRPGRLDVAGVAFHGGPRSLTQPRSRPPSPYRPSSFPEFVCSVVVGGRGSPYGACRRISHC